jgi:hypothetical protein
MGEVAQPYATVEQFAERWLFSTKSVRRWIKLGMPHFDVGTDVRIPVVDADSWVRAGGPNRKRSKRVAIASQV